MSQYACEGHRTFVFFHFLLSYGTWGVKSLYLTTSCWLFFDIFEADLEHPIEAKGELA